MLVVFLVTFLALFSTEFEESEDMETDNLLGVALLTVLGSLLIRRFRIPKRLKPMIPMVLAVVIIWIWLFDEFVSIWLVLGHGAVSGLLAAGMLYILQGLTSE